MTSERHDVLVIGGGPGGAAAGYWCARAGLDTVIVEKSAFPRDKVCGDGLTPRAVLQLGEMGLGGWLTTKHPNDGLRTRAHGITLELPWPQHSRFPARGYVVRRTELDEVVARHAADAGATLLDGTEATEPVVEDGLVTGAAVVDKATGEHREITARYTVLADGANSRIGRALGAARNRSYPMGLAIRGYYRSAMDEDRWIESALDVRDRNGAAMPGYGWVFPIGDGTVNVGIGLLSTFRDYRTANTNHMMDEWVRTAPAHWGLDPDGALEPPKGGRLPMAGSVNPKVGPNWVAVGDAAGFINPFNGEGIDYAYETGRLAAELIAEAIATGDGLALARYPHLLDAEYGLYFKVARLFMTLMGNPALLRELTRVGMHSKTLMEWVLAIMANLLEPDEIGPAEAVYRTVATMARLAPV
ncbi:MAG: geranylgeranyl reductase family protein [Actinobacteria bacterium]|nr:geranylgeranyl reductase family protein [Actinomycetota bacterium]